jgi:Gpi18-like mannosyltransferase
MLKRLPTFLWHQRLHLGLIGLAILLRLALFPSISEDYIQFLAPWCDYIAEHGGWAALKDNFANYTPPYLYWLVISVTALGWLPRLLALKLLPMAVDFLCAFFIYRIVKLKFPTGPRAMATFYAVLFSPTIVSNSSAWGQCDILYTVGLIGCLYYLCMERQNRALLWLGLAFAIKLQTVFLGLFCLALLFRGYIKTWQFLYAPLVYLAAIVPAWLIGRPFLDLLGIYGEQLNNNRLLNLNAPNLYQWLPDQNYDIVMPLGVLVTWAIILTISWAIYLRKVRIEPNFLVTLYTASVVLIPFFLPRMHDRYFFPADVGTILFAAYYPRHAWMPIVMQVASTVAYVKGDLYFLLKYCSLGVALVVAVILYHLYQQFLAPPVRPLPAGESATPYEAEVS